MDFPTPPATRSPQEISRIEAAAILSRMKINNSLFQKEMGYCIYPSQRLGESLLHVTAACQPC